MPPDRGTVKRSTSIKRDTAKENKSLTPRKDGADATRNAKSKSDPAKRRDESLSRSKERSSKNEKQKSVSSSSKEKNPSKQRVDSEKMKSISKDVASDKGKVRELLAKNRSSTESRTTPTKAKVPASSSVSKSSKPVGGTPIRSQLSYHTGSSRASSKAVVKESKPRRSVEEEVKKVVHRSRPTEVLPAPAVKKSVLPDKPKRDRTRTRTLSPHEVKMVRSPPVTQPDRPSDHGDDPSTSVVTADKAAETVEEEYDYEDDFEDYESDFEDDIETEMSGGEEESEGMDDSDSVTEERVRPAVEEEKKLDSGNYDLAESKKRSQQEIKEIEEAMERENQALGVDRHLKRHLPASTVAADEGFEEDEKLEEQKKPSATTTTSTFINFNNAKKRMQERKSSARARRRGDQLLDMIRLDVMTFSLFELSPMPYELFMKSYGHSNTTQVHVQTNEDNLTEEVQTEPVLMKNKWTQKPVTFHNKDKRDHVAVFSQDRLGVGGDDVGADVDSWKQRVRGNAHRLDHFLSSAGQVVLRLLEAGGKASHTTSEEQRPGFSDGHVSLGTDEVPFLAGRPVTLMRFPFVGSSTLLTTHAPASQDGADPLLNRPMVCVWSLLAPSCPQAILVASEEVTAACWEPGGSNLVLGGLRDGSVCVWDLRESSCDHQGMRTNVGHWVLRSATYSTAEVLKDKGHLTEVVGLEPLSESVSETQLNEASPMQVCSVEEAGTLIVWTLLHSSGPRSSLVQQDLGLAHWGRIRLVRTTTVLVGPDLQCVSLKVDSGEPSHLYVGTTGGVVVHCLKSGGKARPAFYCSNSVEGFAVAGALETCPFGQPFFLVGCGDGSLRLHSRGLEQPLATLVGGDDAVRCVQWSPVRPSVFFVLDKRHRVHIWDLCERDIQPTETVQLQDEVTDMRLSGPHLALATSSGQVKVHKLRANLREASASDGELQKFLLYTSML